MDGWIQIKWKSWCAWIGGLGRRSLLVYDAFKAHTTDSVKSLLKRENTDLAVIPGGLTSILDSLDVSFNKPFKNGVTKKWMQWMVDGIHEFTATGQQKNPSWELVCSWISQAWNAIPHKMVTASFFKRGITNNLAGTEDTEELDDSFIRKLFQLYSQSDVLRVQISASFNNLLNLRLV